MRRSFRQIAFAGLVAMGLSGSARADAVIGGPVVSPVGFSTATIEFTGSSAGYTGDFYFLGWGTADTILHFAPDTRETGLGQWLFNNHSSEVGAAVALDALFESQSVLHFAYEIVHPRPKRDLFRTDVGDDALNFVYDASTGFYGVEDLRRSQRGYDGDFNDAEFAIEFQSIPAPGSLMLLGLGGFALTRRRSR